MSEEESFVILGSSPTPSMEQYESIQNKMSSVVSPNSRKSEVHNGSFQNQTQMGRSTVHNDVSTINNYQNVTSIQTNLDIMAMSSQTDANYSLLQNSAIGAINTSKISNNIWDTKEYASHETPELNGQSDIGNDSFLLGSKNHNRSGDHNVMKSSVFDHFPSLCTKEVETADIEKLESLMCEHLELKDNLQKTNLAMRQHFAKIDKWQNSVKLYKQNQTLEINQYKETIAKLNKAIIEDKLEIQKKTDEFNGHLEQCSKEKTELNQEISNSKSIIQNMIIKYEAMDREREDQFLTTLEIYKKENKDLVKEVSNNNSIIKNMTKTIEELEKGSSSFVVVNKLCASTQNETSTTNATISPNEHELIVKELKDDMSNLMAENLEIQDMKKLFHDQVDCLQVNLTSAQELLAYANAEIAILKAKNLEFKNLIEEKENALTTLKDENNSLKTQQQSYVNSMYASQSNDSIIINDLTGKVKELQNMVEEQEKVIHQLKEEINVLKSHLEIYKDDVEVERDARKNVSNERDEILSDLQLLQRRNQQLIDEAQSGLNNGLSSSASKNKKPSTILIYTCPLCDLTYGNVEHLEIHVQTCLNDP